ncbi:MAG: response regulator, partial [Pseudomonadota bacterium]
MDDELYNILIVDDDPAIGDCLKDIFSEIGSYCSEVVEDPFAGLQKLQNSRFDMVFSDILMPKMDGLCFLKKIKEMDATMPVVMITGFPTVDVAIKAMKEGASDFVIKPFKFNQIKIIADKLLRERKILLENALLRNELHQKKTIEELNKNLNAKVKEISILYAISESFSGTHADNEINEVYSRIVEMAAEITGSPFSLLMLIDRNKEELIQGASFGLEAYTVAEKISFNDYGPIESIKKKQLPFFTNSALRIQPEKFGIIDKAFQFSSYAILPLMIKDEVFGILFVCDSEKVKQFTQNDILLLQNLTKKASLSIENRMLYESIFENLKNTLRSLVAAIEARDKYTLNHSIRVTDYAVKIARELGCSQEELDILNSAGHLHDIGKIGVSDTILLKAAGLTEGEFEAVKQHPVIGEN